MKNLKDVKRNIKNLLGKNNKELSIAADEIEESIPYKQRIAAASISEADAQFEIEKNKILNECEKQDLKTLLTNKLCINMMNKSKNKSKKRIIKKDTSNLRNLIIIIICGLISGCLSVGGLLISANTNTTTTNNNNNTNDCSNVACFIFGVIMLVGIMINKLVVQDKLFDMQRLKHTKSNRVKLVAYIGIVTMCFVISVITNNVSMEYLLKSFNLNNIVKMILSVGFSGLFDAVPLLINSCKMDYNLCNYNSDFLEQFNTNTDTNTDVNIDKNLIDNITDLETRQQDTNTETGDNAAEENITENNTEINAENTTENNARNTRNSNTHIRSFKQFEEVLKDTIKVGERVVPSKFNLSNCKTFDNWRNKSKLVEKVNGVWIRVA